jgi:hypothetical protein
LAHIVAPTSSNYHLDVDVASAPASSRIERGVCNHSVVAANEMGMLSRNHRCKRIEWRCCITITVASG